MIITLTLCAVLCAVTLLWILAPMRVHKKWLMALAFAAALTSLTLYLAFGRPDLPATTAMMGNGAEADYRHLVLQEFELIKHLSEKPDDADAMVRLAAVRLAQGRVGDETMRLLARARVLNPKDKRIDKMIGLIEKR